MNVCFLLYDFYPNCAPPTEYAEKMVNMGVQVEVVCKRKEGEPVSETMNGVQIHRIKLEKNGRLVNRPSNEFIKKAGKYINNRSFDIIHVYSFRGASLFPLFNHKASKHWILGIRTGNVEKNHFKVLISNFITRMESYAFRNLVVTNKPLGHLIFGKNRKFNIVTIGADIQKYDVREKDRKQFREKLGYSENDFVLVFLSNLHAIRNPEHVINSFYEAQKKIPEARLLIIGAGDYGRELKALSEKLNLQDKIQFTGRVHYSIIHEYVTASDIGLAYVPVIKQFQYQPPLKTLEYLASGLAVIATDTLGNLGFIKHEENGLIVKDETRSLAAAILRLYNDPELLIKLKNSSRKSIQKYTWKTAVEKQLFPLYKNITSS